MYSKSFYQKSAERKSPKKYFSYFVSAWNTNPGFTSNKSTHYLLNYGERLLEKVSRIN